MRRFAIILFVLALGACASNPISREALVAAESGYGAALSAFNGYKDLCARRVIPSSCRTVVQTIQPKVRVAHVAVTYARNLHLQGNTVLLPAAMIDAQRAINDLKAANAQLGVK